jgi:hypothetical protein
LEKNVFFASILKVTEEKKASSGSEIQWYGSADPDPYENDRDPERKDNKS